MALLQNSVVCDWGTQCQEVQLTLGMLSFLWQEVLDGCRLPMLLARMTHQHCLKGVYGVTGRLLVLKIWEYLIWCVKEWQRKEEGRPLTIIFLTRDRRRKGQWLRCVIGTHLPWITMFSGTDTLQAGQEMTWRGWKEVKWCSRSTLQLVFHLSLKVRRKQFPKLSTMDGMAEPHNWILFTDSGSLVLVCSPPLAQTHTQHPIQHLRQCSGYGRDLTRVILFQVLPISSLKVSFIPGTHAWN